MYKVTIGLEVHCELQSNSKVFSPAVNGYTDAPNKYVTYQDLGFPGILPVVNKEAVRRALKVALALKCETPDELIFDRKNYYYPDLPKGYQITQMTKPVGINGVLEINVDDNSIPVYIHDIHLEEDTASLDHYSNYSLINYNRAGVPLIETVTEPCMHSKEEALAFLDTLRSLIVYCGVSEARTDRGQMRCDVNISLSKDDTLGNKVEIKNVNSFYNVGRAIDYEIERQTEILNNGGTVEQETRRFDDESAETVHMRSKVDAIDYKYFIEPNIVPTPIEKGLIEEIKSEIPMLELQRINLYVNEYNLSKKDAETLTKVKEVSDYFNECVSIGTNPQSAANWINTRILRFLNDTSININEISVKPNMLCELIKMIEENKISSKQAREVLAEALESNSDPIKLVSEKGLSQIADSSEIEKIVKEVVEENIDLAKTFDPQNPRILDFFVGQVMKKTKGKANPAIARSQMTEELTKLVS